MPLSVNHIHEKCADDDQYGEDDKDENVDEDGDDDPCIRSCIHS